MTSRTLPYANFLAAATKNIDTISAQLLQESGARIGPPGRSIYAQQLQFDVSILAKIVGVLTDTSVTASELQELLAARASRLQWGNERRWTFTFPGQRYEAISWDLVKGGLDALLQNATSKHQLLEAQRVPSLKEQLQAGHHTVDKGQHIMRNDEITVVVDTHETK